MRKLVISFLLLLTTSVLVVSPAVARSGCCSHHSGVRADGCGCNDGSPLSDTCAPYYTCNAAPQESAPTTYSQPQYTPPTTVPTRIPTNTPTSIPSPTPTQIVTPTGTPVQTKSIKVKKKKVAKVVKHQAPKQKSFWEWLFHK